MKAEYINPFVSAAFSVLEAVLQMKPEKGQLSMRPSTFTTQQCTIAIGVAGAITGTVMYGMSLSTADRIASIMLGSPIRTFDRLAASAIAELGNMITARAICQLAESGLNCDITPPSIIRGTNVKISTLETPAVVIPMVLDVGQIQIDVSLIEREQVNLRAA